MIKPDPHTHTHTPTHARSHRRSTPGALAAPILIATLAMLFGSAQTATAAVEHVGDASPALGQSANEQDLLAGLRVVREPGGATIETNHEATKLIGAVDGVATSVTALGGNDVIVTVPIPEDSVTGFDIFPLLSTIVDGNRVDLVWDGAGTGARYTVMRDGKLLGTTSATHFTDMDVDPGARHEYAVDAVVSSDNFAFNAVPDTEWIAVEDEGGDGRTPTFKDGQTIQADEEEPDTMVVTMGAHVVVPVSSAASDLLAASEAVTEGAGTLGADTTRIRHTTFIPMAKASAADTWLCVRTLFPRTESSSKVTIEAGVPRVRSFGPGCKQMSIGTTTT